MEYTILKSRLEPYHSGESPAGWSLYIAPDSTVFIVFLEIQQVLFVRGESIQFGEMIPRTLDNVKSIHLSNEPETYYSSDAHFLHFFDTLNSLITYCGIDSIVDIMVQ